MCTLRTENLLETNVCLELSRLFIEVPQNSTQLRLRIASMLIRFSEFKYLQVYYLGTSM